MYLTGRANNKRENLLHPSDCHSKPAGGYRMQKKPTETAGVRLSPEDVRHVCGDIPDWKIVKIVETGATIGELEKATVLAEGADDVIRHRDAPPHGTINEICEILITDEEEELK